VPELPVGWSIGETAVSYCASVSSDDAAPAHCGLGPPRSVFCRRNDWPRGAPGSARGGAVQGSVRGYLPFGVRAYLGCSAVDYGRPVSRPPGVRPVRPAAGCPSPDRCPCNSPTLDLDNAGRYAVTRRAGANGHRSMHSRSPLSSRGPSRVDRAPPSTLGPGDAFIATEQWGEPVSRGIPRINSVVASNDAGRDPLLT
jgi:hypothetical protein